MAPPRTPPPPIRVRLGHPLWVFASMDQAQVTTAPGLARKLDADDVESMARSLNYYADGGRKPKRVLDESSLIGRVEARFPGTRRYLTTPVWRLLAGEEIPQEILLDELRTCPALQGCAEIANIDASNWSSLNFDVSIRPALENVSSFWMLEALILLQALALAHGANEIVSRVSAYFHGVEDRLVLPSKFQEHRQDLAAHCFRFLVRPCVGTELFSHSLVAEIPGDITHGDALDLSTPNAVPMEGQPLSPRRSYTGLLLRILAGGISMGALSLLVFGHTNAEQVFVLGCTWVVTTAVTISPKIGRWTGGLEAAISLTDDRPTHI